MKNQILPKTLFPFFTHFIKAQWKWFLPLQFLYFGWALDHTLFPYILSWLVDTITNLQDRSMMWSAIALPVVLGAGLWLILEVFYRSAGFIAARVTPQLEANVRLSMFDYIQKHSYTYFSSNFAGSLSNKISDMVNSMTHILQLVMTLFLPVMVALAISTTMFASLHPLFAIILVSWVIIHISTCWFYSRKCAQLANSHAEARTSLAGKIVDSFSNHLNVRLFSRHRYEYNFLTTIQKDEMQKHGAAMRYVEKMKIVLGFIAFLGPCLALNWYTFYSWQTGTITTGEVVFIFNTTWNITIMAWLAGQELPNLFREIGVCTQALTIIKDPHDIVDETITQPLTVKRGEITFENVTFHYTPKHNLFQNKNITIEAGSKVGLVGFSGSGKTTFVHLILRYFDVEQGRILIDGQDIAMVPQDSLREQIAMIPQDTSLFHRNLMENIRYGRLNATDEEVMAAAKQASCAEFIDKLPEKYNTLAGERGVKLSGGQRQRIAIARAILKNAPILILDEATSALDSMTEKNIQDSLAELMQGRTTLVIAHRLSTLSGMDRILVFKEGKIIEDGTHDELINDGCHYAEMWNMQAGGFLPDAPEEWEEEMTVV